MDSKVTNSLASAMRSSAGAFFLLIGALACTLSSCDRSPTPQPAAVPSTGSGATITATPNPVPAGSGPGATTISWDTGDGSKGQIYFAVNNGTEKKWFDNAVRGSQEAPWINKGAVYEFRLYAGQSREKLLASVKVSKL